MKTCFKCKAPKSLDEFYRHPQMGDGYLGKCKECTRADTLRRSQEKPDYIRAYEQKRRDLPHRIALRKRVSTAWLSSEKTRAHNAVRRALIKGTLTRLSCEMCGSPKSHAHHDDYSQPLAVIWLCPTHHKARHAFLRYLEREAS